MVGVYVKRMYRVRNKKLKTTFVGNLHISGTDRKGGTSVNLSRLRPTMQHHLFRFVCIVWVTVGDNK